MGSVKTLNPNAEVMGRNAALFMNINAAKGLYEVMKTNFGPKGTIKMLVSGAGGESAAHTQPLRGEEQEGHTIHVDGGCAAGRRCARCAALRAPAAAFQMLTCPHPSATTTSPHTHTHTHTHKRTHR